MRRHHDVDALGDLLALPLVAVLATYRANGDVLLSPVWHEWRDGGFDVITGSDGVKVRHLRRDPRAGIVVHEHVPPYRGVELRCRARLLDADPATVRRIASRYLGERERAEWAAASADDTVVRLEPGDLRAWDFADEYA